MTPGVAREHHGVRTRGRYPNVRDPAPGRQVTTAGDLISKVVADF
jgi:hypothetical protein